MKDFLDHLQEAAKKPKPIVLEAERLRMEAKEQTDAAEAKRLLALAKAMTSKYRDELGLGVLDKAWHIKNSIKSWMGSVNPAQKDKFLKYALKLEKEMERSARTADKERELEKSAMALPPITVCDIFSDPTPKRLYQLMDEDLWFQTLVSNRIISSRDYSYNYDAPAWMDRLKRDVWSPFVEWFEAQGGSKQAIIPKILAMASCKKRAAWANWSGTAYRGLKRSLARVAKYEYTDKTVVIGGKTWLVASVSYQSKYAVQSWSSEPKVAKNFADGGMSDVAVILEMDIKKGEGFLSPEVSNRLASNYEESEVLRIGNAKTKVKAYIEVKKLVNLMLDIVANTRVPSWWDDLPSDQKKKEWIRITSEKLNRLGFSKNSIENMTKPNHPFVKEMLKGRWG